MKNKIFLGALLAGVLSLPTMANITELSQKFEQQKSQMNSAFETTKSVQLQQFEEAKKQYAENFNAAMNYYADTWDSPKLSSASQWITYSEDQITRRTVDFETGDYTVEIIGELNQQDIDKIVANQTSLLSQSTEKQAVNRDPVLSQYKTNFTNLSTNKVFSNINFQSLNRAKKQHVSYQRNGQKVTTVAMKLPQDSLSKRALEFVPQINKQAKKWNVAPELIIAIMHTESHFNPVAQSHIPAYGLMQIVPVTAGKDVTRTYMKQEKVLSASELFDPDFNIEVGSAYLNILNHSYLKNIQDPTSRTYVAISAYNGGIGAVARHFTGTGSLDKLAAKVNTMNSKQVYSSLVNNFPYKETRDYLKKVEDKRVHYAPYF